MRFWVPKNTELGAIRNLKNAVEGKNKLVAVTLLIRVLELVSRYSRSKESFWGNLRDFMDFRLFVENSFSSGRVSLSRENTFKRIFCLIPEGKLVTVFEYGVAHGYLTDYLLRRFDKKILEWNGFDTFSGLPDSWRGLPKAYFDNGGVPPLIYDQRIIWHVGYVQETLHKEIVFNPETITLHIFDLDLYEPSLFVWNKIKNQLKIGDVLYFDEAFDRNERRLLIEDVLVFGEFQFIGCTVMALAIRYLGSKA